MGEDSVKSIRKPGRKELAELNEMLVEKDRERIRNYVERKNLQMKETESGLWFSVQAEGEGEYFRENDRVIMEFKCYLLDGTLCYSSDNDGHRDFVLGKSETEAGLIEGIKMLRNGGKGMFILPPFMAYGITGDNKSIPPRAILVYEIEVKRPEGLKQF